MEEKRVDVRHIVCAGGHYAVVNGKDLAGSAFGEGKTTFWHQYGKLSIGDYRELIIDSQDYFKKIVLGEINAESEMYYVYGNANTERLGRYAYKTGSRVFQACKWIQERVVVYRDGDVYRHRGCDGAHRFAAARGMDLLILVYVDGEPYELS